MKKLLFFVLFCVLFFLTSNSKVFAATYYVAGDTGLDSRTALQAQNTSTPWQTIQKAATTMVAGDTVNVKGGLTYTETVTPAASGTAGNVITYQSWSGTGIPIVHGVTDGFVVSSKNYLTFQGFWITGPAKGFNLSGGTNTYITLENNIIAGCTGNGIDSGTSSIYILIDNNTINGNGDTGIKINAGSNNVITNNIITNNFILSLLFPPTYYIRVTPKGIN